MIKICPEILIISNKHDFATDHVVFQLRNKDSSYLRLNRDQFSDFKLALSPVDQIFYGEGANLAFEITPNSLKSVYFRAPVYLRDIHQSGLSPDEQLHRSQWAAFIRGLTVFDFALWINHPQATYQAEIKPFQLYLARKIGFDIPDTLISNSPVLGATVANEQSELIVKTLDTAILHSEEGDAFIYTNRLTKEEMQQGNFSSAPVVIQEALIPKVDIRVTVVCDKVFAVTITQKGHGIDGDWRLQKRDLQYTPIELPAEINVNCRTLVKTMRLQFGAIDLALYKDKYYFLEINPTVEWAWLVEHTGLRIDEEIAAALMKGPVEPI
jgi:RimK-like ATP-grasp domain